jgi:uncharacterized protein (DUF488 family)
MLDAYKKLKGDWDTYAQSFNRLMRTRQIESAISRQSFAQRTVLLCSEATAEHCHRRLVLEYLQGHWDGVIIRHL